MHAKIDEQSAFFVNVVCHCHGTTLLHGQVVDTVIAIIRVLFIIWWLIYGDNHGLNNNVHGELPIKSLKHESHQPDADVTDPSHPVITDAPPAFGGVGIS